MTFLTLANRNQQRAPPVETHKLVLRNSDGELPLSGNPNPSSNLDY
jgi:hypothetical protein